MTVVVQVALAFVAACFVVGVLVYGFRDRLIALIDTRQKRVLLDAFLILLQVVVAVLLASLDFGYARTMGTFNASDNDVLPWLATFVALGFGVQIFVMLHADRSEIERKNLEKQQQDEREDLIEQRDAARAFRDFIYTVTETLMRVVSHKRERLKQLVDAKDLHTALDPKGQIAELVIAAWEFCCSMLEERTERRFRLRVAYYRRASEGLELCYCWNGTSADCVSHRDGRTSSRFRFDDADGCLATAAALADTIYRVPDTATAHRTRSHPFVFFDDGERATLRSIAAIPIKIEGEAKPHSVLVVDTDEKGFFNEDDVVQEEQLQVVAANLAQRLLLEERMAELLGVK